ncbi:MarR family winged helix-turn-helix transcriptional regulator [Streptomyces sp. NPDC092296]|uniref:MarR family winged helix-turn-helix transcriptional regulator n=1 Tax=Streptomyces sp. NPDC092296 TaxID=3366012 RepID=UPI0038288641
MPEPVVRDTTAALERVLASLSYLLTRSQAHDRQAALAGVGLSRPDAHLLLALESGAGACRVGDLADRLLVEASHVTRQVARLQARGLVERSADPLDRRARRVVITPQGTEVLARLHHANRALLEQVLHGIDDPDLATTARVLSRIVERYARRLRTQEEPRPPSAPEHGPADVRADSRRGFGA